MWDLISSTLRHRSVILTTHSMEEAEALCQRIGIMAAGKLRALGSNQELKAKFGKFYQLDAHVLQGPLQKRFKDFMFEQFQGSSVSEERGDNIKIRIPKEYTVKRTDSDGKHGTDKPNDTDVEVKRHSIGSIFRVMESHKRSLGCDEYSVSEVSLEQIFLQFARLQEHENMTEAQREHAYVAEQRRLKEEKRERRLKRLRRLRRARAKRAVTRARAATALAQRQRDSRGGSGDSHGNEPAPYLTSMYQEALARESERHDHQLSHPHTHLTHEHSDTPANEKDAVLIDIDGAGDAHDNAEDVVTGVDGQNAVLDTPTLQRFMSERPITAEELDRGYNSNYDFATDIEETDNETDTDYGIAMNAPPTAEELRTLEEIEEKEEKEQAASAAASASASGSASRSQTPMNTMPSDTGTRQKRFDSVSSRRRTRSRAPSDEDRYDYSASSAVDSTTRPRSFTDRMLGRSRFGFLRSSHSSADLHRQDKHDENANSTPVKPSSRHKSIFIDPKPNKQRRHMSNENENDADAEADVEDDPENVLPPTHSQLR